MKETPQRTDPAPKPTAKERPISVVMSFHLRWPTNESKKKVREELFMPPAGLRQTAELGENSHFKSFKIACMQCAEYEQG